MENRVSQFGNDEREQGNRRRGEPQPISAILAELLFQYQVRFPEVHIVVVETPAVAI